MVSILIGGNFDAIVGMAKAMGIVMGLMTVLTILGYYVYCLIVGGQHIGLCQCEKYDFVLDYIRSRCPRVKQ